MRASSSPWYEAWYFKTLAICLGAGLVYLGQTRYERALQQEERRENVMPRHDSDKTPFAVLAQADLAGVSEDNQKRLVTGIANRLRAGPLGVPFGGRGLIWISQPSANSEGWSYQVVDAAHKLIELDPVRLSESSVMLRVPYATASGIGAAELWIKKNGATVAKLPLKPFRPVPIRKLDLKNEIATIVIAQPAPVPIMEQVGVAPSPGPGLRAASAPTPGPRLNPPNPPRPLPAAPVPRPSEPPHYHVRLKQPLPDGQTAFVRLASTEYTGYTGASVFETWTPLRDSEADLPLPCGGLAKKAELKFVFLTSTPIEKTITVPIGRIVVQHGQPTFMVKNHESIRVSGKATIDLDAQGEVLWRRPPHPNRAIHIVAAGGNLGTWTVEPCPDFVSKVDWVAPDPAKLGLDTIQFFDRKIVGFNGQGDTLAPWGIVQASTRPSDTIQEGPLIATFKVHLTTFQVDRTVTAVVPISTAPASRINPTRPTPLMVGPG